MDRQIVLSDLNACYASIEIARDPNLRGKPVAVCGSVEERHGIILAKSDLAKQAGIKTGMVRWQAMLLCPNLITVPPNIELYRRVTNRVREIYSDYSNLRDDFSIDESWIDLTGTCRIGKEVRLVHEIRERLKAETGLTASMGLSWNRIFAKIGSDIAGPDAVAEITRDNMKDVVWPLPADVMMGVGRATKRKLNDMGIETIGELAAANPDFLKRRFGKNGTVLYAFANGIDTTPIRAEGTGPPVKSIGNSTTTSRDMVNDEDVRIVLMTLAESVGMRLREERFKGYVVEFALRTTDLRWLIHQRKIKRPTNTTWDILEVGFQLYKEVRTLPLRSIGIRVSTLVSADEPEQMNLFENEIKNDNQRAIDRAVDTIREAYGFHSIQRGLTRLDEKLGTLNAREENVTFARF
ncbi:MAG: DNA polymerase IV [Oscillospiraceae bacterium]|nr:DNA polymerase IV [Oscillospiraceae bacterium]